MWVIAFFGMATIYAEAVLAQQTRVVSSDGTVQGGPVYYIKTAFKGKFGKFLACSGYPDCKHTEALALNVSCPREGCTGKIVQKCSKKGKVFYGCNRYPDCNFVSWNEPTNQECPNCHEARLEIVRRGKGSRLLCPKCAYSEAKEGEENS